MFLPFGSDATEATINEGLYSHFVIQVPSNYLSPFKQLIIDITVNSGEFCLSILRTESNVTL